MDTPPATRLLLNAFLPCSARRKNYAQFGAPEEHGTRRDKILYLSKKIWTKQLLCGQLRSQHSMDSMNHLAVQGLAVQGDESALE